MILLLIEQYFNRLISFSTNKILKLIKIKIFFLMLYNYYIYKN